MDDRRDGVRTISSNTMAISGRGFVLSVFAGQVNGASHRAFDAAVLWRVPAPPFRPRWRDVVASMAPRDARRSEARSSNPFSPLGGWSVTGDGTADRWVGFHKARGVVRVDGRDYPVRTDDQTVVLLAATRDDGRVTVTSHALLIAAFPAYRPSLRSALLAPAWAAVRRRAPPVDLYEQWLQRITSDRVVASFLAPSAEHGAT